MELDLDVTDNRATGPPKEEKSLLDASIENFRIARQYMDDASCGVEQKLISFHLAVALLAQRRQCDEKLREAEGLLLEASDWNPEKVISDLKKLREGLNGRIIDSDGVVPTGGPESELAIRRIRSEATYNLGVVYELQGKWSKAIRAYREAIRLAEESSNVGLESVSILSRFGEISAKANSGNTDGKLGENIIALQYRLDEWDKPLQVRYEKGTESESAEEWGLFEWIRGLRVKSTKRRKKTQSFRLRPSQVSRFRATLDEIRERLNEIAAAHGYELTETESRGSKSEFSL